MGRYSLLFTRSPLKHKLTPYSGSWGFMRREQMKIGTWAKIQETEWREQQAAYVRGVESNLV